MDSVMYVPIAPGIRIQVPVNLTPEEIQQRIERYKINLEKSNTDNQYNPKRINQTKR